MSWVISPSYKDPDYSSVSLLLHGNGTNGSTTFTDSSPTPKTTTRFGNTQISTAQSKFGGSSISFDGNGDYLLLNGESAFAFGIGDFTIEMWAYRTDAANNFPTLFDTRASGEATTSRLAIYYSGFTANLSIVCGSVGIVATGMQLATWYHIALSRASGSLRLFVDGIQQGTAVTDTSNQGVGANRPAIGTNLNLTNDLSMKGYIDDLRITKGVARYTSNFSVPPAQFPDI
jgi:hypothetical protein